MPKLKLLLDENLGHFVADKLRQSNFDVLSILETRPGASDKTVLTVALVQKRIVITLDKDFGTLAHLHSRKHAGVILLRLDDESPKNIFKILNLILKRPTQNLKDKFIVATETKIRLR